MLTRKNFYTIVIRCLSILLIATLLFACAPNDNGGSDAVTTVGDGNGNGDGDTVATIEGTDETIALQIYRCDDVYRTKDTLTHGAGTVTLVIEGTGFEVTDCELLLCDDGCATSDVVSRASQGYAVAYNTVAMGELEGNYPTSKFALQIIEGMMEGFASQEEYKKLAEKLAREYLYLLKLDDTHYAYICIKPTDGTEKLENEADIVDGIVKTARVEFTAESASITTTEPAQIVVQPYEYIFSLCAGQPGHPWRRVPEKPEPVPR